MMNYALSDLIMCDFIDVSLSEVIRAQFSKKAPRFSALAFEIKFCSLPPSHSLRAVSRDHSIFSAISAPSFLRKSLYKDSHPNTRTRIFSF